MAGQWLSPSWEDVLQNLLNPAKLTLYRFNGNDPINVHLTHWKNYGKMNDNSSSNSSSSSTSSSKSGVQYSNNYYAGQDVVIVSLFGTPLKAPILALYFTHTFISDVIRLRTPYFRDQVNNAYRK